MVWIVQLNVEARNANNSKAVSIFKSLNVTYGDDIGNNLKQTTTQLTQILSLFVQRFCCT